MSGREQQLFESLHTVFPSRRGIHTQRLPGGVRRAVACFFSMQPPWLSEVPFTLPFELFAHTGKLWIQNDGASTQDEFHIKGVNWAGFQVDGCPHALWRTSVTTYVNHIVDNGFNAVRIPLSAPWVHGNWRATGNCGSYRNWRTLDVLDDVIRRLAERLDGIMRAMRHTKLFWKRMQNHVCGPEHIPE